MKRYFSLSTLQMLQPMTILSLQSQTTAPSNSPFRPCYVNYQQYAKWAQDDIHFVTRLKDNAVYQGLEDLEIPDNAPQGYLKDEKIQIRDKDQQKKEQTLVLRRVAFYDQEKKKVLQFLTNIFDMTAEQIGLLYKMRWQIELLFKQLKQNFPLKYFLGDNENAIKIQIWCTLIANLLFTIINRSDRKIRKRMAQKKYR